MKIDVRFVGMIVGMTVSAVALLLGVPGMVVIGAGAALVVAGGVVILIGLRRERAALPVDESDIMTDDPWL